MRPVIGVTCDTEVRPLRFSQSKAYIDALIKAGGAPTLIPHAGSTDSLRATYERLDGILVSGGADVAAYRYGAADTGLCMGVDEARDECDWSIVGWAIEDERPVLAICRGSQALNVIFGGTLYQDLGHQYPGELVRHRCEAGDSCGFVTHPITIEPGSLTASLMGAEGAGVVVGKSGHHQAIKDLGQGLVVTARTSDGVIEGVEAHGFRFVVGVQWHPEETTDDPAMLRLLTGFVAACGKTTV